ncbi:MAG: hypothetical protein M0R21_09505 [Lentimicrobiaceae bacterium]|jgi:predicted nuclease with TOPRIM domain|nr:hypothetical protein [Lentimicrobiaceae bacterium]
MAGFSQIAELIQKKVLAFQSEIAELKAKTDKYQAEKTQLENKVAQLNEELRMVIQENKDLKEIVYETTRENTQFKTQMDKTKPGKSENTPNPEMQPTTVKIAQQTSPPSTTKMEQLENQYYNYDADENNFDEEELKK